MPDRRPAMIAVSEDLKARMSSKILSPIPATLIPGDGIGPEVVEATVQMLDALGSPFAWDTQQAGMAAFDRYVRWSYRERSSWRNHLHWAHLLCR